MKKVFLHGWATDKFCFNELEKQCVNNDVCECLFLSMPGHHSESISDWNKPDITIASEKVKQRLKGIDDDIVLIGWSLGGKVFLKYLADNGDDERIKGLVLMNSSYRFTRSDDFPFGTSPSLVKTIIKDLQKDEESTLKRFYRLNFTEKELKLNSVKEFLNYYESSEYNFHSESILNGLKILLNLDLKTEAQKIKTPTLIITTDKDRVCSHKASEDLNKIIKDSTLVTLNNLGHAPFVSDTIRINTVINNFISETIKIG